MAELWPSRDVARPRNVADWMLDRLDDYTAMPAGSAKPKMPYDEVLDEARRPAALKTLELRPGTPRGVMVKFPAKPNTHQVEPTLYGAPDGLGELRRQQAEFNEERRRLDKENRPLAYGALAAPALLLGSEFIGGFGFPAARAIGPLAEFNIYPPRRALTSAEKPPIWKEARGAFSKANGASAAELGEGKLPDPIGDKRAGQVHHRIPNEHDNKFVESDPNRVANLIGIPKEAHDAVTASWNQFRRSLGRDPTQAELLQQAQKVDRWLEQFILRRGLPRPPPRVPPGSKP